MFSIFLPPHLHAGCDRFGKGTQGTEVKGRLASTKVQILAQLLVQKYKYWRSCWYNSANPDAPSLCPENQARLAASQAAKEVAEAQRKAAEAAREREKRKEEVCLCKDFKENNKKKT